MIRLNVKIYSLWITLSTLLFILMYFFSVTNTFAQYCQQNTINQGLISTGDPIDPSIQFGNSSQVCISGSDASYRDFKVPTYQDIEDQFFTLSRSTATKHTNELPSGSTVAWGFTGPAAGNNLWLQKSNVAVNQITGTGVQIIFVEGNLDITGDITYPDPGNESTSGLVFVVRDNINIYSNVETVNAVLISSGTICTAYVSGSGCPSAITQTEQLTINGGLISLNKNDLSTSPIQLMRSLQVNNQPAEKINKQAKYLYILRNGLFTRNLVVVAEDQQYDIDEITDITPGPVTPPPPNPADCESFPTNPYSADNIAIPNCIGMP